MSAKIEFNVQMTCQSCVDKIRNGLALLEEVEDVDISLENGSVVVQTTLPSIQILETIEATGRKAVLKGYGGLSGGKGDGQASAVSMLGGLTGYSETGIRGVVRMVQANDDICIIEGTIDGLTPGLHGLHIHECGDISKGCESLGEHFSLLNSKHGGPTDNANLRHTGDLGNIEADEKGRARFRFTDSLVKVPDILGRSIVVTEQEDDLGRGSCPLSEIDGNSGRRLACGIISRSSGLFENSKRICACDGVTLWDERDRPIAGPGRRVIAANL